MKNKKKKKRKGENGGDSEIMLDALENQVTEVKDITITNIEKMQEREGKLEDLEYRADILSQQTDEFKTLGLRTRRNAERKSRWLYFIFIGGGIFAVVVILLTLHFTGNM